jgi:hypothetical protein
MNIKLKTVFVIIFLIGLWMSAVPVAGQDFEYLREESPAVSWNGVPLFDARMMGAGGVSFLASDAFMAVLNPALIAAADGTALGASYFTLKHEAFQYWGINQGPVGAPEEFTHRFERLSGLAVVFPYKKLHLSAGWYTTDLLQMPYFDIQLEYFGYTGRFPGVENTFFTTAAFKLKKNITLGIKLEYISGKRDVEIDEQWKGYPLQMQHRETHRLKILVPSIGVLVNLSPAWKLGASLRVPLRGKVNRTLDRIFDSEYEHLEVSAVPGKDSLYRPTRLYLGVAFSPLEKGDKKKRIVTLTLAGEAVYSLWKQYKYEFFSEFLEREMRNTLVLALGLEFGVVGRSSGVFLRLGYRNDPQPITVPETTLQALTYGLGFRLGGISVDVGGIYYYTTVGDRLRRYAGLNSSVGITFGD